MSGYPPYAPLEGGQPPPSSSASPSHPSQSGPYYSAPYYAPPPPGGPAYPGGYADSYPSPYAYPQPAVYSEGFPPPPQQQPVYGVGHPPPPTGPTGAVAMGAPLMIPPPALPPTRTADERRKVSCMVITEVIFAVLLCWFAVASIGSRWSKLELKMGGNQCNINFYLSRVKQDGDNGYCESKTFNSYSDYKHWLYGDCENKVGDKFEDASDGAKGTLVFPFIFAIAITALSLISMSTRLKNPKLGVVLIVVFIAGFFFYAIPASVWSDKVPSKDDVMNCYLFETGTYYRIDTAPALLFAGIVLCLIGSILACLDVKSAKRYQREQSMREPIS